MIDLEAIVETDDGTRFDKVTALLIGTVAILAAVLGTLQIDLNQQASRAAAHGARLSVRLFEGSTASSARSSFELQAIQDSLTFETAATGRVLAALERGGSFEVQDATMRAELAAGERLRSIATAMGIAPRPEDAVDPAARRAVSASIEELTAMVTEQNRQVDLSETFGERGGRAVLGLSIVALAGVLAGLAAVLGEGGPGRFALGASAVAVAAATIAAISAAL